MIYDSIRSKMPARIDEILPREFFNSYGRDEQIPELPSHHELGLRFLAGVGRQFAPSRILEIGVRLGYSLGVLAKSSGADYVEGWDSNLYVKNGLEIARDNFSRAGLIEPELVVRDSQRASKIHRPFDLVHVDADHRFGPAFHDIVLACSVSRVVVVDDYHHQNHPGVYQAARLYAEMNSWRLYEFNSSLFGGESCKGHAILERA